MLEPTGRHLFVDGLRPPPGFRMDVAVGTTYTLGLVSLLLPPLAMAAHDRVNVDDGDVRDDDIALLEAVRRLADRTTVFCHAGAIHVPGTYRRLLTFAEDCVVEVLPSRPGRTFHPKLWALRFSDGQSVRHRLLVLSRNLTGDRSWDTVVQLEEDPGGAIDGAPAAAFLRRLPEMAVKDVTAARSAQVEDLSDTLQGARFATPAPFTRGELWPLGVGTDHGWPMPGNVGRPVVISPFLDQKTLNRVPARDSTYVSRPDTFDELGSAAFSGRRTLVLDPLAETTHFTENEDSESQGGVDGEPDDGDTAQDTAPWEVRSGLHAKVLVWNYDGSGWWFVGSANATGAAFDGNVEFNVLLRGPQRSCGPQTLFPEEDRRGELTLSRILTPYAIEEADPRPDPGRRVEMDVAAFHAALATAGPQLVADEESEGRYDVRLAFTSDVPEDPGVTTVRPLSRSRTDVRALGAEARWPDIGLADLTPFIAVMTEVTVDGADTPVRLECVLKAELLGVEHDRPAFILRTLLDSEDSVLRYLSFLLDEAGGSGWHLDGQADGERAEGSSLPRPTYEDLALLETLVRAAGRGDESLTRVHSLMRDLRDHHGDSPVVSEQFLKVWEAVWAAVEPQRGGAR